MATTGFWPVRGRLKDVLNYAENPDKTTVKQYLDEDLQNALKYAENSDKTDEQMFVSGINCSKSRAYEEMCAVKKRSGERGKVIAYHGYTVYDVSADFSLEGKETLLNQFKKLILSTKSA